MTHTKSSFSTVNLVNSLVIATILASTIAPILLLLTTASLSWIISATLIWTIGSILVFHPFIVYIYPHLMTKVSVYILSSILIFISTWLNITLITFILPYDYLYYSLLNATITQIALWGSIYIIFINAIISNFVILSHVEFYQEEQLF